MKALYIRCENVVIVMLHLLRADCINTNQPPISWFYSTHWCCSNL